MAASFLQYCATCEKQILNPSNSILYCSDVCRRKDSCKPLALAAAAMSPPTTPPSSVPSSPRPILPLRTPTGTMSVSTLSLGTPTDIYNAKSYLDTTGWKPKLRSRGDSDAFRYLSQFHRSTSALGTADTQDESAAHRPPFSLHSTASMASLTPPSLSLSQTSTSTSSSFSAGAEHDFTARPLQSRQNPIYSASAGTTKGIDLVIPFVAPSLATSLPKPGRESQVREEVCCQDVYPGWRRAVCIDWSFRANASAQVGVSRCSYSW